MPTVSEIIKNAKAHLRDIAGEAMAVSVKENKKLLDELKSTKVEFLGIGKEADIREERQQKELLAVINGVETAIKNQEVAESVTIKNPEAITGDLKAGLEGIINTLKEEVKNFDKQVTVKNDLGQLATLFKGSKDKKAVIEALKRIEDKIKTPELTDYTMILSDIANALEDGNHFKKDIIETLEEMFEKETNVKFPDVMAVELDPNLIEKDRVKVVLRDDQVAKLATAQGGATNKPILEAMKDGSQIVSNFYLELALGNITGKNRFGVGGGNPGVSTGVTEHFWEQTGAYTYLTTATTLYISSSSASDVGQVFVVLGLDGDYNRITGIGVTNGQNQVAVTGGDFLKLSLFFNASATDNVGDLYIAETDSLTAGVPDTASKIKLKAFAGTNQGFITSYTCPLGKQAYIHQLAGTVGKSKDATVTFRTRLPGGTFNEAFPFEIFQSPFSFFEKAGFLIPEKMDIDLVVTTRDTDTPASAGFEVTEITL